MRRSTAGSAVADGRGAGGGDGRGAVTVDLNTAANAQLATLPRVSAAVAGRIVEARRQRPFTDTVDVAARVRGLGAATTAAWQAEGLIAPLPLPAAGTAATASGTPPRAPEVSLGGPVDLNSAPDAVLVGFAGVGPTTAGRIVAARPFASLEAVAAVSGVGPKAMAAFRAAGAVVAEPAAGDGRRGAAPPAAVAMPAATSAGAGAGAAAPAATPRGSATASTSTASTGTQHTSTARVTVTVMTWNLKHFSEKGKGMGPGPSRTPAHTAGAGAAAAAPGESPDALPARLRQVARVVLCCGAHVLCIQELQTASASPVENTLLAALVGCLNGARAAFARTRGLRSAPGPFDYRTSGPLSRPGEVFTEANHEEFGFVYDTSRVRVPRGRGGVVVLERATAAEAAAAGMPALGSLDPAVARRLFGTGAGTGTGSGAGSGKHHFVRPPTVLRLEVLRPDTTPPAAAAAAAVVDGGLAAAEVGVAAGRAAARARVAGTLALLSVHLAPNSKQLAELYTLREILRRAAAPARTCLLVLGDWNLDAALAKRAIDDRELAFEATLGGGSSGASSGASSGGGGGGSGSGGGGGWRFALPRHVPTAFATRRHYDNVLYRPARAYSVSAARVVAPSHDGGMVHPGVDLAALKDYQWSDHNPVAVDVTFM